jgi:hypothetical protein
MVDAMSSLSGMMPSTSSIAAGGMTLFKVLTYFLLFLVGVSLLGVGLWVWLSSLKYKMRIIVFEKINGRMEQTGTDKAMEVKYGSTGDYVIYLKKRKKYLAPPTIQMGKRTYWYCIREDGEWFNVGMEDIDVAMRQAKAKFLHTEARAFRTAFQQNLKTRLQEQKFMEKYGAMIMNVVLMMVVGLIMWFMADKLVSFLDKLSPMLDTMSKLMDTNSQVLQGLDKVCSNSGYLVR